MVRFLFFFLFTITCVKAEEPPPQVVITGIVKESSLNQKLNSVGTFTAYDDAILKAETAGRIEAIHFKEGESVKANQKLFSLHNKEQEAKIKKAEAELALSRSILEKKQELARKNFGSVLELEQAQAKVKVDEAELALAIENLEKTIIRAPFEGILSERKVSKGSYVIEGDELVRIQDLTPIRLTFQIPEKELTTVKVGDKVIATTDAYTDKIFEGSIEALEPSVNEKTRSVTVYARCENKDKLLLPGLYGRVSIGSSCQKRNALVVPEKALVIRQDGTHIYKKSGDKAILIKVSLGLRSLDQVEILSGLQKGDEIVLEGQDKIRDGSSITISNDNN